jgi:polyhydroxybutyrate depolymerase
LAKESFTTREIAGDRHYELWTPKGARRSPLVIIIHGYTSNGARQDGVFGFSLRAEAHNFAVARAEGRVDALGHPFWDASATCCDWAGVHPDDVAYLDALIDDAISTGEIDADRIYLLGHSNGAFLAYRYGCTGHRPISAMVALAGFPDTFADSCVPLRPFSLLHLHGEADDVSLTGGVFDPLRPPYPTVDDTLHRFAKHAQCTGPFVPDGGRADLERELPGAETHGISATGCGVGRGGRPLDVRGWFLTGAVHVPAFRPEIADELFRFFENH